MVIHVRPISNEEGNRLRRIVRHGKDPIELKRAQVILSSAQGFTPPRIGDIVLMTPAYVRERSAVSTVRDSTCSNLSGNPEGTGSSRPSRRKGSSRSRPASRRTSVCPSGNGA